MEIGTPACSMSVRVVCLESCVGDPAQADPTEQPPELVGVPLGVNRHAQLVGNQVLAALVPVKAARCARRGPALAPAFAFWERPGRRAPAPGHRLTLISQAHLAARLVLDAAVFLRDSFSPPPPPRLGRSLRSRRQRSASPHLDPAGGRQGTTANPGDAG